MSIQESSISEKMPRDKAFNQLICGVYTALYFRYMNAPLEHIKQFPFQLSGVKDKPIMYRGERRVVYEFVNDTHWVGVK